MLSVEEINQLIDKLDQSSIDEFSYEANGAKIKMKKNTGTATSNVVTQPVHTPQPAVQPQTEEAPQQVNNQAQETKEVTENVSTPDYDHEIVSPMVGTFYSSPSPDKENYVQTGDNVQEDSIVCIVEAMKLFNEIEADVKGTITEVLVENGELVEYGQPLFRIKKA
ncbi:acetyl-CoA carboxylase biotin carboxyl carrier protein [Gracilibacillus salinarum]|uniref:Biotin carboxyl carrier protein of acetyl-CoA carboxylase n=1 Tax=Gracilibacillus salinarum TaxID=2932255 RepID=A0ABY4GNY7_9BACI|nr:acetyl-CoA carboxylase biotin carboxyl carrier protein [Gracilibacillus salinarum]UOQ85974.1 acetyl-CoA carboxylase biotin carboxyl carrier protein [Gracilibacillus salinarum]